VTATDPPLVRMWTLKRETVPFDASLSTTTSAAAAVMPMLPFGLEIAMMGYAASPVLVTLAA
jgi:hypothetical protein